MYEPPIKLMRTQINTTMDEEILKAVFRTGVVVDKEELLRALEYDRQQYNKGYHDGFADGLREAGEHHE